LGQKKIFDIPFYKAARLKWFHELIAAMSTKSGNHKNKAPKNQDHKFFVSITPLFISSNYFSKLTVNPTRHPYNYSINPKEEKWTVRIGNVVAFSTNDDCPSYSWDPFQIAWNVGQILHIYADENNTLQMEILLFYRSHQLDVEPEFKQPKFLFWSKELMTVQADKLLGPVHLINPDTLSGQICEKTDIPIIHFDNSFEVIFQKKKLEIKKKKYTRSKWGSWHHSLIKKDLIKNKEYVSAMTILIAERKDEEIFIRNSKIIIPNIDIVKKVIAKVSASSSTKKRKKSNYPAAKEKQKRKNNKNKDKSPKIISPATQIEASEESESGLELKKSASKQPHILSSRTIDYFRSAVTKVPNSSVEWNVRIGDAVAVHIDSTITREDSIQNHLFKVPWKPCQILSIHRKKSDNEDDEMMLEVIWLQSCTDNHPSKLLQMDDYILLNSENSSINEIFLTEETTDNIPLNMLLAPIHLITYNHEYILSNRTYPETFPHIEYICDYIIESKSNTQLFKFIKTLDRQPLGMWTYSVHASKNRQLAAEIRRSRLELNELVQAKIREIEQLKIKTEIKEREIKETLEFTNCDNGIDEQPVYTPSIPIHVNLSSKRVYFDILEAYPPYFNYINQKNPCPLKKSGRKKQSRWQVNVGDLVAVEVFSENQEMASNSVFNVAWSPVEIVAIWKETDDPTANELRSKVNEKISNKKYRPSKTYIPNNDVMIEVRWFYKKSELPREFTSSKNVKIQTTQTANKCPLEEVFETDHLDDIPALSILSPIQLFHPEESIPLGATSIQYKSPLPNMPTLNFLCHRFYSVHYHNKGSLLPCGPSNKRKERGWMYSNHFKKDPELKLRSTQMQSASPPKKSAVKKERLKDVLEKVRQRLTLAEASEDTQARGISLKCREREESKIKSFLTDALQGQKKTQTTLYIAGPPGTGKTATVLSVISQLRQEQIYGNIPDFDFCCINAMELRQPSEMFVVLWEAVSTFLGHRERVKADQAARLLARHFSGKSARTKYPMTILLLDEVDYLVTKDQAVLYNIFDWPKQSGGTGDLVVIGISNTINLPNTLTPRVQSRLEENTCIYSSYSVDQIVSIITDRLSSGGEMSSHVSAT